MTQPAPNEVAGEPRSERATVQSLLYPTAHVDAPEEEEENYLSTLNVVVEPLLFGRYRRMKELGRGGMGVVSLAHDQVLGIPVALKLVPEEVASSAEDLENLRKEVLRGMALTHTGIVRVYSFERDSRSTAIVMEYVDGESLADLKAREPDRCFEPEQLRPILEQLCPILDYAHGEARIAHRDLKPRNLMMTRDGRLKVADFGIASSLSETLAGVSIRHDSSGTPPYMSPQQAMGERPTSGDDIYAMGATLYDLLTSKAPFFRGNIIAQVLHENPPPMNERRKELGITGRRAIPEAWERAIAACLAKEPSLRPPNGAALLQLLDTSPYAPVPYAPRAVVPLDTLRLDQTLALPPLVEAEIVDVPVRKIVEKQPWRESWLCAVLSGVWSMVSAVCDAILTWLRRILLLGACAAAAYGAIYLYRSLPHPEPSTSKPASVENTPAVQPDAPRPQAIAAPEPPPMPSGPPPGWMPPPPPPPMGGPGGPPPGPRGGRH